MIIPRVIIKSIVKFHKFKESSASSRKVHQGQGKFHQGQGKFLKVKESYHKDQGKFHNVKESSTEEMKWNDGVLGLFCAHCLG